MAKLWRSLLGRDSVTRYSLDQYAAELASSRNNLVLSYGSSAYSKTEDLENSFTGYIQQLYKSNGVVFAVMLARALLFSEARFTWQEMNDGRPGDLFWSPDLEILEEPWPNATCGEMLTRMDQDVSLSGNSYIAKEETRLRRLRPDWLTIVLTAPPATATKSDVAGYWHHPGRVYTNVGEYQPGDEVYLPGEICHWSPIPDPEAQYRGMSWLTPIVKEIMADKAATSHKLNFFNNGATLGAVISAKENLTDTQFQQWMENFNSTHQGVDNAYRPTFFASPVDVNVRGLDLRQLDFKVTQGAGETRIAAAGGVPPIIVGLSEGLSSATYSNYGMARRKFGDHWARPMWRSVAAALSALLDKPGSARLWYDDRDIAFLREDQKDQAEILKEQMLAAESGVRGGFKPDSVVQAIVAGDLTLMEHTGLFSVQLLPPERMGQSPVVTDGGSDEPDAEIEVDAERGGDGHELKEYWTRGAGLAKWANSPHPWTALYHHLLKYLPPERAKRTAAEWFHLVKGYWPGHQKGANPVGPG